MTGILERYTFTGRLPPEITTALRAAASEVDQVERLGRGAASLAPASVEALRRYRQEAKGGSVPHVGARVSRVDRLVIHSVAVLGISPSKLATIVGCSPHWGSVQVRVAAGALAADWGLAIEAVPTKRVRRGALWRRLEQTAA